MSLISIERQGNRSGRRVRLEATTPIEASSPTSGRPVRLAAAQLRAYASTLGWVLREALTLYPLPLVTIIALNLFSLAAGAATFGAIVLYARHVETGAPLTFKGVTIPLPSGLGNLLAFAAALTAIGLLAGYGGYLADRLSRRTAVLHGTRCMLRALRIAADPAYRGWQLLMPGSARRALSTIVVRDARMTSLALRRVLASTLPASMFIAAMIALIATGPLLTALLIPLALAYLVPLYFINRTVARQQKLFRAASPEARRILKTTLDQVTASDDPLERRLALAAEGVECEEQLDAHRLFHQRRIALSRMQLLNTSFFVLALGVLFTYFAIQTQRGGGPGDVGGTGAGGAGAVAWSALLLYVIALQFAVTGLRQTTVALVQLSRVMPEVQSYVTFIRNADALRDARTRSAAPTGTVPAMLTIQCQAPEAWSCPRTLELQRGKLLWVMLPWRPAAVDLQALPVALERASGDMIDLSSGCRIIADWLVEEEEDDGGNNVDDAARASPMTLTIASPHVIVVGARVLDTCNLRTLAVGAHGSEAPFYIAATHQPDDLFASHLELRDEDICGVVVLGEQWQVLACGDLEWARDIAGDLLAQLGARAATIEADEDDDGDEIVD